MPADLPRRLPTTPRLRRWWQRRVAWRRRPSVAFPTSDSWREGHDRRSIGHRYHAGLRRWPRRALIGTIALVVVVILLGIAAFAYAFWRYHELDRTAVVGLVAARAGSPFDVLIVGTVPVEPRNGRASKDLASLILLARIDPKSHEIRLVAVPDETEVAIANGGSQVSSTRPIAEALEGGPGTLVRTIATDFYIPINDYLSLKLSGVGSVVGALGGIHLDFAYPVHDAYSGLSIDKNGCQLVSGSQAEALFDSRHLYYFASGAWRADLSGTSSVIARQSSVFAATVTSSGGIEFDPVELNNLVSAAVANLTVDNALSESKLLSLAETFRGFSRNQLTEVTLPTVEAKTRSGQGVTAPSAHADDVVLARLLTVGTAASTASLLRQVHVAVPPGLSVPANAPIVDKTVHLAWNPTPC
jgi:anionic cell wall polymer biosynthesis LytR-Cps2A-Psr (LCP) family protein